MPAPADPPDRFVGDVDQRRLDDIIAKLIAIFARRLAAEDHQAETQSAEKPERPARKPRP